MRFAIAATDRYLGVFDAFVSAGWKPLKLFITPKERGFDELQAVTAYAEKHKAVIQSSPITAYDLSELGNQGCKALIIASYDRKVCDWRPFFKYAVNFHPSPLPEGRGPYPIIRAIIENRKIWGVTCHQLTAEFDKGAILAQEIFPLHSDESHESIDLKVQMAATRLAVRVAGQFLELWEEAEPQKEGSYWKKPKLEERFIDFHWPVDNIMRYVRAFGPIECLAKVNDTFLIVRRAVGWTEQHNHKPGSVAHMSNRTIVVAAGDGYVGLLDYNIATARPEEQPTDAFLTFQSQIKDY